MMKMNNYKYLLGSAVLAVLVAAGPCGAQTRDVYLDRIELPQGFRIELFADDVPNARSLARAEDGTIFVGTRTEGAVYALRDTDGDGRADESFIIDENLNMPNGVAVDGDDLIVAEIHRLLRYNDILGRLDHPPEPEIVYDELPDDQHHGWKYIAFGPDGWLYVPVGAPCNVCDPALPYSGVYRIDLKTGQRELVARGMRNTVGFDWDPQTGDFWFTDNGRDWLGDDRPPDELNHVTEAGQHFGYPFCHGRDILDPEFGQPGDCEQYRPPAAELGPHVAALGMLFYDGDMFPDPYRQRIFIAEHGSWNRSSKIGYRVMQVIRTPDGLPEYKVFARGWEEDGRVWGRPVALLQMPDGSLLVSDDYAGAVYRIVYTAEN